MIYPKENVIQRYYLIILAIKGNLTRKILEIKKSQQQQNKSNFFNGKANMGHTIKQQGKWIATWKGEIIQEVDGYYENELKLGQLKQPSKNYWRQCIQNSQAQLYESGEYYLDYILGDGIISMITKLWMIINQFINGGESYDYGSGKIKIGYWIDSHDRFSNYRQLAHNGRWEIEYRYDNNHPFSKIGRGLQDDGLKIGKWTDLVEGKKSNLKVGRWDIEFLLYNSNPFSKMQKMIYRTEIVVDNMMTEIKWAIGLIWMNSLSIQNKQFIMMNIQIVKILVQYNQSQSDWYDQSNSEQNSIFHRKGQGFAFYSKHKSDTFFLIKTFIFIQNLDIQKKQTFSFSNPCHTIFDRKKLGKMKVQ